MNKYIIMLLTTFAGPWAFSQTCYNMDSVACEVFHLTNQERQKLNLPTLQYCESCFQMAQEQSSDMANKNYFSHTRPTGETFWDRAQRFELQAGAAENIAMNHSAARAVQAWMNSPGHRKNMLSPKYHSFAVGYQDGLYTQVFWVNEEE